MVKNIKDTYNKLYNNKYFYLQLYVKVKNKVNSHKCCSKVANRDQRSSTFTALTMTSC